MSHVQGKDMPKLLMQEIQQAGVTPAEARTLVVQCFDLAALVKFSAYMKEAQYDIPLMLLVECETGLPNKDTMLKLKALSSEAGIGFVSSFDSLIDLELLLFFIVRRALRTAMSQIRI